MKKLNITLILLLLELSCFNGHAILKRKENEADTYKVREDKDTLEIINPKANKPTLREIIYYHVIEKPYSSKHQSSEENNFKPHFNDVIRPFTNGHGFQYLKDHHEINSVENKEPPNHEPRDEINSNDSKRPNEMNSRVRNVLLNDMIADEVINDQEDRPNPEEIETIRRPKREIDYSEMPPPPPLPPFRMDILPDYIKSILPTENEFQLALKSTEKPIILISTEDSERNIEQSEQSNIDDEQFSLEDKPRISIRIGGDEIHDEQIPIKPHSDHKVIKKSPNFVNDDIEEEIREVLRMVSDDERKIDKENPPSYGMDLIGNGGIVWSELNNQHYEFNVGPDAMDDEIHDEQIPIKPHEINYGEENEVAATLNELEHILENIVPNNNNLHENNIFNESTTEGNDIEIIIHKNKPQLITKDEKYVKEFTPKIDPRSLIEENDNKLEPESNNSDNPIDLDTALNILEVLQEIVANANNSINHKDDDSKVKLKTITEGGRKRKHYKHKGKEDKDKKKNEVDSLLNNDKYWEWLKDSSQATLSLLMKYENGIIKGEVAQQIQDLVTKMKEKQGHNTDEPEKQEGVETKQASENDKSETTDENVGIDTAVEESDVSPQILKKLKESDKWKWLSNSSEAYLGELLKGINKLIKEEVTKQVEHLIKYHMPNASHNESSDNNDSKQNSTETLDINPDKSEIEENKNDNPKNEKNNVETAKTAKDDLKAEPEGIQNEIEPKSHKATQDKDKKYTNKHSARQKNPLINISAENSYGSAVGNEKVINVFIFNINSTDLKNLKPLSGGNGMFVFGNDNTDKENNNSEGINNNKETTEKPDLEETEQTNNLNVDSTTNSNLDETTVASEDAKPIDEEKSNLDSNENSNKDENTTTSSTKEKNDNSNEDLIDSNEKEAEHVIEDNLNKENSENIEADDTSLEKDTNEDVIEEESSKK